MRESPLASKYEVLTFLAVLHDETEPIAAMDKRVHVPTDVLVEHLAHQLLL